MKNDRSVDGSERILANREVSDLHERIIRLRNELSRAMISCHDARMIRNAMLVILDILIPEEKEIEPDKEIMIPGIRAHSEVVMHETTERIDKGDGTEIRQETSRKVL